MTDYVLEFTQVGEVMEVVIRPVGVRADLLGAEGRRDEVASRVKVSMDLWRQLFPQGNPFAPVETQGPLDPRWRA